MNNLILFVLDDYNNLKREIYTRVRNYRKKLPPCLHLDFVNNSGTIRNGFFQKTANSGYYSNRGRQIENIMYIIDKLGLTQLYLGTYVHYIKNGFQPYFRAFLCL